jgi:hypothetical protein
MDPSDGARARALLSGASGEDAAFLLRYAREAPLLYGHWRYVKGLYKDAEAAAAPELLGTLIARMDAAELHEASASPSIQESLSLYGVQHFAAEGNLACVSTSQGVHILDLSDPAKPRQLQQGNLGNVKGLALSEGCAYILLASARNPPDSVQIVDLTSAAAPEVVAQVRMERPRGMAAEGGRLFVVEGTAVPRLRIFDVSSPAAPVETGAVELPDAHGIAVWGTWAFVSLRVGYNVPTGVYVVDVSNPARPVSHGFVKVEAAGMLVAGQSLPGSGRGPVWIGDPALPARPPEASRTGLLSRIAEFFKQPRGEADPSLALPFPYAAVDVDRPRSGLVHRGHAFLFTDYQGARVFSLSEVEGPRQVAHFATAYQPHVARVGDCLYVLGYSGSLEVWHVEHPENPVRLGFSPRKETFGYMKRRARRLLRRMAEEDPERFAETAFHALTLSGQGRAALDLGTQWVSLDLLYGASDRYEQTRHGRGRYELRQARPRLRTREERGQEAWDRRPDLVRRLYSTTDLPWQTHETMLKILLANRAALPPLEKEARLQFLSSPSPLLIREAVRQSLPEIESGGRADAALTANVFFFSNGAARLRLEPALSPRAGSPGWARPFTASLFGLVGERLGEGRVSRRIRSAAGLLARCFSPFVTGAQVFPLAERLLLSAHPELVRLALAGLRNTSAASVPGWVDLCTHLSGETLGPAWEALVAGLRTAGIPLEVARELVSAGAAPARVAGWSLLLALSPDASLLQPLWEELLAAGEVTPALQTALSSPAAIELMRRSGLKLDTLAERVAGLPSLVGLLSVEALEVVVGAVSVEDVFKLMAAMDPMGWSLLKTGFLRGLARSGRLAAFWKAAPDAAAEPTLWRRLTEDPEFARSFLEVDDPSLVEIGDPPWEGLLFPWVQRHEGLFIRGSAPLLAAATHPLPRIRSWALQRVREQGMDLPFALRLLESAVPSSMELGRSYFQAVPSGDAAELPHALALCDSPDRAVRDFGREYIRAREETLPLAQVVGALSEHGDPEMNRFLAETLLRAPDTQGVRGVREFDRGVLRARNRGRRAKEQVKARLQHAGDPDIPLLQELVRSGTPRDAEWALQQLARLAAEGHSVEGLSLEGVAGV